MKALASTFLLFVLSFPAFAQGVRFVEVKDFDDYQTVLKVARDREQMLLVALHDGGSAFRRMFDEKVFEKPAVVSALKNYLPLAIDRRDSMGRQWQELFPAGAMPTFYFLNEEEFLLHLAEGFVSPDSLSEKAKRAERQRKRYDQLLALYNTHELAESDWNDLLRLHGLNFPFNLSAALAWEYLNQFEGSQVLKEPRRSWLLRYGLDLETRYPRLVLENRQQLKEHPQWNNFYARAYSYNLDLAIINADSNLLNRLVEELLPYQQSPLTAEELLAPYKLFGTETQSFSLWKKGALAAAKKAKSDTAAANLLFEEAYAITDAYNSEEALSAALELAQASLQYQNGYRAQTLEAYLLYLQEEYPSAQEKCRAALRLARNSQEARQATNLLKMIEEEIK